MSNDEDDVTEGRGLGRDARTGGIVVDASAALTTTSESNLHLIQNQIDDDFNFQTDDDETDARGQRRRVLKDAMPSSLYGL